MNNKSMSGHQSNKMLTDEWLTPPIILNKLGVFDLDPCSPINRPWDTAKIHYTINDNGLIKDWEGRVWLNPPYGQYTKLWMNKLALHNNGIALIFARTETSTFFESIWPFASAILFIKGRIHFYNNKGERAKFNSGAPSCLIAYGLNNLLALKESGILGKYINLIDES